MLVQEVLGWEPKVGLQEGLGRHYSCVSGYIVDIEEVLTSAASRDRVAT